MRRFIFIFLLLLFCSSYSSGVDNDPDLRYTISGYIRDAESGEELIGATVLVREIQKGSVMTNR